MELGQQIEAAEVAQMCDGVRWRVAVETEKVGRPV